MLSRHERSGKIRLLPRQCASCSRLLPGTSYSRNQWRKSPGLSRCAACVHGGGGCNDNGNGNGRGNVSVVDATQTARRNNAHKASFTPNDLNNPFAQGSFRRVAQGKYTEGGRAGQPCVCKWFKTGGVMESHFYDSDLEASKEAIRIITIWNSNKLIDKLVQVNLPEVWTFENTAGVSWAGKKILQEPFIQEYQKFNSNTGWTDDSIPWARVMQALSHYSYHTTNGQTLLCDLQGGVYSNGVVLTDPVVMSNSRRFGPTDLGSRGISTFFGNHVCNEFCRREWQKPRDQNRYHNSTAGTTMEHHAPTRGSRPNMTMGGLQTILSNNNEYTNLSQEQKMRVLLKVMQLKNI
mmetsp:Transcript_4180/g.4588  ORF Transcript_4180/g.4588 Transcript_4180/m.4588 type:complete len:350 (-) Transcript_4180:158-1207(-)